MSKYTIFGTDAKGVEKIKGNGWDINSERIELNCINAELICEDDYCCVSMNGPAVEDIFKCIRDLIKENGALTGKNERLIKENQALKKFCEEQREYFNAKIERRDAHIRELEEENANSDEAKEILNWIDGEMKNGTDYATKIFNKEDTENIFSITFCKVPAKSEEDE